jgi:hypothetical protein
MIPTAQQTVLIEHIHVVLLNVSMTASYLLTYLLTYSLTHSRTHFMVSDIIWKSDSRSACQK